MKIGIFGGAFNPVHIGHIQLADAYSKSIPLDRLFLVPSKKSPHKSSAALIAAKYRLEMCRLAARYIRNCAVSDIEIRRDAVSYTCDTLLQFKDLYPNAQLYLLCGSDMFLTLQEWRRPDILFENAVICGAKRADEPDSRMEKQKKTLEEAGATVILTDISIPPVSSTMIREAALHQADFEKMVTPEVYRYIKQHKLYESGIENV